jgi:predicted dehydrogenase
MGAAHVRAVVANPRAELVAVCDVNEAAVAELVRQYGVSGHTDYEELLALDNLDAVIVVLPHYLYPPVIVRAAERGLHILKEKPFARNLADARTMAAALSPLAPPSLPPGSGGDGGGAASPVFMVAAQRQFSAAYRRAGEIVAAGRVGDVYLVHGTILYSWNPDGRNWRWRGVLEQSGGIAIVDSGWHILEAVQQLKGAPEKVYCSIGRRRGAVEAGVAYEVDDKGVLTLEYPDGAVGSIVTSYIALPNRFEILLHGTAGNLEVHPDRLILYDRRQVVEEFTAPTGEDLIGAQLDHFLDAVLSGQPPACGLDEALLIQSVIEAAYRSAATGEPVLIRDT